MLFVLFFLAIGLFAVPKINSYNNISNDIYDSNKAIQYINNAGTNLYALGAIVTTIANNKYNDIYFSNYSLLTDTEIILIIHFNTDNEMDNFITQFINSPNLEKSFIEIRDLFEKLWQKPKLNPIISSKNRKSIKTITYEYSYNMID